MPASILSGRDSEHSSFKAIQGREGLRLTLLEHSMAICNNENFSLSLSVQLCKKQHFD